MPVVINGTSGITDVDGTAAAPAITGTDTDTGTFFPAANTIAWSTGGTERARVDSSGNVGIGTSSPSTLLTLNKATGTSQFQVGASSNYYWDISRDNDVSGALTFKYKNAGAVTEAMRIDSSGNVGIGTSSPAASLSVAKQTTALSGTGNSYGLYMYPTSSGLTYIDAITGSTGNTSLGFRTYNNGTYNEVRIDSSGYMWIKSTGGTSPWDATSGTYAKFGDIYPIGATAQSNIVAIFNRNTTTGSLVECKYNGAVVGSISVTASATAYNTSSDYRLKHDIQPMTGALAKVAALKPVTYKWNADNSDGEGFIAHELAEVVPQCVTGEKDAVDAEGNPVYQGIDTSFLVATLTAAIQELKVELDATKAEIAALKGQA